MGDGSSSIWNGPIGKAVSFIIIASFIFLLIYLFGWEMVNTLIDKGINAVKELKH